MTDELTIQGVNPQMQQVQKKNNTVPYTLGGAAVGAAAGWGATALYKGSGSSKSYEDLVKEANDKDKLELTSKKDAVTKAEQELAEASKAIYEGAEKTNYDNAVAAKDEAWKKLYDSKKKVLELGSGEFDIQNPKFENFDNTTFKLPDGLSHGKAKKEYDSLTKAVVDRVNDLNADLSGTDKPRTVKNNVMTEVTNLFEDLRNTYDSTTDTVLKENFFNEKYIKNDSEYYTYARDKAKSISELKYPEVTASTLKKEEYLKIPGSIIEDGKTIKPADYRPVHNVPVTDPVTGMTKYKTVFFNPEERTKYIDNLNLDIKEKRKIFTGELLDNAKMYVDTKKNLKNIEDLVHDTIHLSDAEKMGAVYDAAGTKKVDIKKIMTESQGSASLKVDGRTLSGYDHDIEKLKGSKTLPKKGLNGNYTGAKTVEEALTMAEKRKKVAETYNRMQKEFQATIDGSITKNSFIAKLDEEILEKFSKDEKLQDAIKNLKEKFPELKLEGSNLTSEQIETQAKEFADKNLNKSFTEAVERTKGDLDKVIAEKGKVNETAKKTAQEAVEKAKGELDKLVAELNGRVKGMSGTAKALVIGGVAAAGALIGLSMSNKSKNV